jgi:hypothetical protein
MTSSSIGVSNMNNSFKSELLAHLPSLSNPKGVILGSHRFAAIFGLMVFALGTMQTFIPLSIEFLTGFGEGVAGKALGFQWLCAGLSFLMSVIFRVHFGTIMTGSVLLIVSAGAFIMHVTHGQLNVSALLHATIAIGALAAVMIARRSAGKIIADGSNSSKQD